MCKFVLVPDSFKGTLSSQQVSSVMREVILEHFPEAEVAAFPLADGGEGSAETFLAALGGEMKHLRVTGPRFLPVPSFYALLPDGTAVIELAAAAGLPLMGDAPDVMQASTFGVGELMADALNKGARKMLLCLGGSATNDGACGAAAALGIKFYNDKDESFVPVGATLEDIVRIDKSGMHPALADTQIDIMCDVDNPLCGDNGAAAVFGPQKGASAEDVKKLDAGLEHLAAKILEEGGPLIKALPGAGAAGGFGGGAAAFFGGRLRRGIETLLDLINFDEEAAEADFIFTGEGKLDTQSAQGKVISGVSRRARALNKPVIAVVGAIDEDISASYEQGLTAAFSINRKPLPFSEAKPQSAANLRRTMGDICRLIRRLCIEE